MEFYSNESNLIFAELKLILGRLIYIYIYKRGSVDKFGFRDICIDV